MEQSLPQLPAPRGPRRTIPTAELRRRVAQAEAMLQECNMCALRCGVDRTAGRGGRCRLGAASHVYKHYVSLNEELGLVPALRVFLGGCNFRCPWCDEAPDAFADAGASANATIWAARLKAAVAGGVRVVSILGGEPTLHVHTLLRWALAAGAPLPIALNSNMYMTPEVLDLLDGVVTCWLADYKFGNDECARRLAGVPRYEEVVRDNLLRVAGRAALVVRHVLMPGHLECCLKPVAAWVGRHLPGVHFQLYPGYVPCGPASCDAELGRLNRRSEVRAAEAWVREEGLRDRGIKGLRDHVTEESAPGRGSDGRTEPERRRGSAGPVAGMASLTLGADGHIYCHDLPVALVRLLTELCPDDPELKLRAAGTGGSGDDA